MKYYLIIINLVLITTITWFTASGIYGNFEVDSTRPGKTGPAGKSVTIKPEAKKPIKKKIKPESAYGIIDKRNLFKTEDIKIAATKKPEKTSESDLKNLEKTSLSLQLLGTVIGNTMEPYAIILDKKLKKEDLYNVDDKIQSASIKAILNEKVVLNVGGKDEILTMEQPKPGKKSPGTGPPERETASRAGTGSSKKVNVNLKRDYIDGIIQNPLSVISDARVRPYLKNGQTSGLIISHIKRNSIFSKAGLKNGDIITSINGEEIESMDNMMGYYENLKNESNVSVNVTRRGRTMQIDYSIE